MSLDADLFDDDQCNINLNVGGWGARLYFTAKGSNVEFLKDGRGFFTSGLVTKEQMDRLVEEYQKVRECLPNQENLVEKSE